MPKFDIPKSWDPGYAVPAYVKAEGLQTRAFVTRWAPRGTYDDPDAKDPSWDKAYAQPQYVQDEGYGQGAAVTQWPARGTYYGFSEGRTKQQVVRALGDDAPLPAAYDRYGKKAARAIMLRLQAVSPAQRKTELRKLLDAIDPTLWARTEQLANKQVARGMAPGNALQVALARAMGAGIAGEILELGVSKTLPKARSLLGLGCYGCVGVLGALGETVDPKAGAGMLSTVLNAASQILGSTCTNPPTGFTWDAGGFWRRIAVNEVPAPNPAGGCYAIDSRTGQPAQTQAPTTTAPIDLLKVGPWLLRNKSDERLSISKNLLTPEQNQQVISGLAKAMAQSMATGSLAAGDFATGVNLKDLGWGADVKIPRTIITGFIPIARFTHPETKKQSAIYVKLIGTKDAPQLQVTWGEVKSFWASIIGFLVDLIAAIVKPILEELGNLACQLVGDPAIAAGTQVAAGAATGGAGAGAAVAGVGAAQNLCGGGAPAPPEASNFPLVPVIIAGGAVLALAAFWPKRKKTP